MATPALSSTQAATVEQEKTAVLRVRSKAKLPKLPDPDPNRVFRPDLTGLYESIPPAEMWNSSRVMQLNQCGRALVGWMSYPPPFVQPIQEFPAKPGVFIVELCDKTSTGYPLFYKEGTADPNWMACLTKPRAEARAHPSGYLDFKTTPSGNVQVTVQIGTAVLDFSRTSITTRLSSAMIAAQEPAVSAAYHLYQQQYIPSSYLDITKPSGAEWKRAVDMFSASGPLAAQIRAYVAASGPPPNHVAQMLALEKISALAHFPWEDGPHARLLNLHLSRRALQNLEITGHSKSMTFADWLAWIDAKELARHRTDAKEPTDAKEQARNPNAALPAGFKKLLAGETLYRYDLKFDVKGPYTPKTPTGYSGGVGGFSVTISFFTGTRDFSKGDDAPIAWDAKPGGGTVSFFGAFLECKAGLGSPPGLPDEISFVSGTLLKDTDFNMSWFEVLLLEAGAEEKFQITAANAVTIGPKVSVGGATYMLRLHTSGEIFEGFFDKFSIIPEWSLGNVAKSALGMETWKAAKSWFTKDLISITKVRDMFGPKVAKAGISLGVGMIGYQRSFASWNATQPRARAGFLGADGTQQTPALFKQRECSLSLEYNGWSARFILETMLATDLAIFEGAPTIELHGYASPEGFTDYNQALSELRAAAVRLAVQDALGHKLSDDLTTVIGHGEGAAEQEGLHDPEEDKQWTAHMEERDQWPEWRKVDLRARGKFVLSVLTTTKSDGT